MQQGPAAQSTATQMYQHMIISLMQSTTGTAVLLLALEKACLEAEQVSLLCNADIPQEPP